MAFYDPLKNEITVWGRTNKRSLIVVFGVIAFLGISKPILWPDGFGISEGKSVITTVEKDKQGNVIKTVETTKVDPGKTLWDWLGLLGVPGILLYFGNQFQQKQRERDEEIAKQQRELAANEAKEEVLQVYFDRLSTLLVDKNLLAIATKVDSTEPRKNKATPEEFELLDSAVDVIRARNLSILRRFGNDIERKTSVIRFLIEADIVSKLKLNLSKANLSGADLRDTDLRRVKLYDANLRDADLRNANLSNSNLCYADLSNSNLCRADLRNADLSDSNLSSADLSDADLREAFLLKAKLGGADLKKIKWNTATRWPDKKEFAKARNIPDKLRDELGLSDQEP